MGSRRDSVPMLRTPQKLLEFPNPKPPSEGPESGCPAQSNDDLTDQLGTVFGETLPNFVRIEPPRHQWNHDPFLNGPEFDQDRPRLVGVTGPLEEPIAGRAMLSSVDAYLCR